MHLSEKDLHSFWRNSNYFKQKLSSTTGRQIEVVRRGDYNRDAGPDFRGAVLKIDGRLFTGDIEIHLDARDWYNHQHHQDPGYNGVILHLALVQRNSAPEIICENGQEVLQTLVPKEVLPAENPNSEHKESLEPLQVCPLRDCDMSDILTTVEVAGKHRVRQKTARFDELVDEISWDQLLYSGVAEALGYSKNQKPFLRLASLLPIGLLFSEIRNTRSASPDMIVSTLLFGGAGFFDALDDELDAEVLAYAHPRKQLWESLRYPLQLRPLDRSEWISFKLRPQNFPARRIAAVAEIVLRFFQKGMLETLIGSVTGSDKKIKRIISELRAFFLVKAEGFWAENYDFVNRKNPGKRSKSLGALVGAQRADDLLINVVLPILKLYAESSGNASLANRIDEIFANFPALQENEITRKMHAQLFPGETPPRQSARRALFQQGLIHLHKNYCAPLRCQLCLELKTQR